MAKAVRPKPTKAKQICGIVMPISAIDGCTESHWTDVYEIVSEAIDEAGFEANLVSNADDVGVIQKRIIQNLYDNPIVVCDVSGKNPNVMFELGIRLAFDKPTIIIKDDKTTYSFDTSPIEHLEYPRDLRFNKMIDFKEKLSERIKKTYEKATADATYSTFLKHFGEFKVAKIDQKEVPEQEFILEELRALRLMMYENNRRHYPVSAREYREKGNQLEICFKGAQLSEVQNYQKLISEHPGIIKTRIRRLKPDHTHMEIIPADEAELLALRDDLQKMIGDKYRVRPF